MSDIKLPSPFGYARLWEGDASDENHWMFETDEADTDGREWIKLYSEQQVIDIASASPVITDSDIQSNSALLSSMQQLLDDLIHKYDQLNVERKMCNENVRYQQSLEVIKQLVEAADRDPFTSIGHLIEHVVPQARGLVQQLENQNDT